MKNIVVIGSGGFSKQVIEMIEGLKEEYNLLGIIDDEKRLIGKEILGYKIIGDTNYLRQYARNEKIYGVIAIADPKIKEKISNSLDDVIWTNLIHPSAIISKHIKMGKGNIVCANVVINPESVLGDHCHINISTTLGHDVTMLDYVTIMPGARISGNVLVKSNSMIGTGVSVLQNLIIEEKVILGAGSVVIKNTEKNSTYIGVPAKKNK
ncbi:acetyltransferase [Virgibacillus dokdonensis]|uniref:acetyltransferase n=1 Tax=Virgibacillus dokdonensis TaxID=302167 RepID=UPI00098AE5CA|nr:acetyltransferase [Virgibacillus dokdonensis]